MRNELPSAATMPPASVTRAVGRENDPEVSDLNVGVDAALGEAAAPSPTRMKQIGVKPSLSESATTASQPWPRASCLPTEADSRHRHGGSANGSASGTVDGRGIENTSAQAAPDATTAATTIVSARIGKKSGNGCIAAASIEVRMRSSPTEMSARQDPGVVGPRTTTMTALAGNPEIPRSVVLAHAVLATRLAHEADTLPENQERKIP